MGPARRRLSLEVYLQLLAGCPSILPVGRQGHGCFMSMEINYQLVFILPALKYIGHEMFSRIVIEVVVTVFF